MKKANIFYLVICALMCAICAVLSQIAIPTPFGIPITLQVFVFALIGYVLGTRYAFITVFLYIVMGALGLPVFYGLRGGISAIIGDPTGGFIIGFIPLAVLCGVKRHLFNARHGRIFSVLIGFCGVIICHICGISMYTVISGIPFLKSCVIVSLTFILKDFIFCFLAYLLSGKVIKVMKKSIPDFK